MLRVCFATGDGIVVDQHFGRCDRFDVYGLTAREAVLVASRLVAPAGDDEGDRITGRLDAVRDCAILHVADIGGSAAARVVNAGVHPLKVPSGSPVDALTVRLQGVLAGTPPPWLRKVLRGHDPAVVPAWRPR